MIKIYYFFSFVEFDFFKSNRRSKEDFLVFSSVPNAKS